MASSAAAWTAAAEGGLGFDVPIDPPPATRVAAPNLAHAPPRATAAIPVWRRVRVHV